MSFLGARVVVAPTTPSSLNTTDRVEGVGREGQSVVISNPDSLYTIYLGSSAVASTTGYPLAPLTSISIDAGPGEVLYAVSTASAVTVSCLYQGI